MVLPTDHPRKGRREFGARRLDYHLSVGVIQNLRALRAKQGCSFFTVLLSSLAILFARISGQRHFVIALPIAEQPAIGQPGLVGHCVNLLPFAVELHEGESVYAFIRRVQSELLVTLENCAFTMISLLEELRPSISSIGISPIPAGLTNVKKFKPSELPQSGFAVEYDANPKAYESFELYLNVVEIEESVELHCHYDIKLFDELTIQSWLAILGSIFQDLAGDPTRKVLDLARLMPAEPLSATKVVDTQCSTLHLTGESCSAVSIGVPEPHPTSPKLSAGSLMEASALLPAMILLWQRVLDVQYVGPDDDFFELGGHSIIAAQLFTLIESELGCTAPLATLYEASTPRTLASVLSLGTKVEAWQSLVPINRFGDRPPLFLVHAAEGNILLYRSLAAHLGADQPVFGLQSAGLNGRSPVNCQFESVAQRYLEEIRQVQPHGPYLLGGYCLGGTLAMEMGRQLIEAGETVSLVALIEAYNIRSLRWPLPLHQRFVNRFLLNPYFHLQNLFAAHGADKRAFFEEKLRVELVRIRASAHLGWERVRYRLMLSAAVAPPRAKIADIYDDALTRYDVKPYPGELTLFLAKRHMAGFHDRLGGWERVAQGGVRLFSLPISPRGSLVEPYVGQLAYALRGCVDRAIESSKKTEPDSCLELVGNP